MEALGLDGLDIRHRKLGVISQPRAFLSLLNPGHFFSVEPSRFTFSFEPSLVSVRCPPVEPSSVWVFVFGVVFGVGVDRALVLRRLSLSIIVTFINPSSSTVVGAHCWVRCRSSALSSLIGLNLEPSSSSLEP
ncbi:uncharacterized protein LOC128197866 [Vigna angularis]|uniref:uncharacterized protein LOC128197866 n=1 Tax=Phaseolus angularis TaxID=3914 RepID=UPI0022B37D47|nr:uncharacterized protein LOC128197866 [Vigna angularis]